MDYIEDQLQRTQPELLVPYREALKVLETDFKMRFSFSALMIREIVEKLSLTHGQGKSASAAKYARQHCRWLEAEVPSPFSRPQGDTSEMLTLRGHLLLSFFLRRPPSVFTEEQQATIRASIKGLIKKGGILNGKVHGIVQSSELSDAEGRSLIGEVLQSLAEVLRLKRTILDTIEIWASDSASASISPVGGSHKRELPHPPSAR